MTECDILVVEDEVLFAMDIQMTLNHAGYDKVSVCHTVDAAIKQLESCPPKMALLDFNLGNNITSLPIAQRLRDARIPFIFLSGHTGSKGLDPNELDDTQRIAKPFQSGELIEVVRSILVAP